MVLEHISAFEVLSYHTSNFDLREKCNIFPLLMIKPGTDSYEAVALPLQYSVGLCNKTLSLYFPLLINYIAHTTEWLPYRLQHLPLM